MLRISTMPMKLPIFKKINLRKSGTMLFMISQMPRSLRRLRMMHLYKLAMIEFLMKTTLMMCLLMVSTFNTIISTLRPGMKKSTRKLRRSRTR